jgi:hypothetical protein
VNNLTAMQCMWYALECGASHVRQRQYGRALKRYHEVAKVRVAVATHPALARACLCLCGLAHQTHLLLIRALLSLCWCWCGAALFRHDG